MTFLMTGSYTDLGRARIIISSLAAVRFGALCETQVGHLPESGKCQEATYAMQQTSLLLDHLVGANEQRVRHVEADRGAACLNAV